MEKNLIFNPQGFEVIGVIVFLRDYKRKRDRIVMEKGKFKGNLPSGDLSALWMKSAAGWK